jgi:outer membrane protein TolC
MLVEGKNDPQTLNPINMISTIKKYCLALATLALIQPCAMLTAQEDSLRHYLSVAEANNPAITAGRLAWEAALRKLPQAGAYADPTLEAGVFLSPMELAEGRQVAQFQLMQMFPWFGARKAARTEAQHMANMAFEQFREVRDNVFMDIYVQWYALWATRQKLIYSEASLQWLEHVENLALRKYTSAAGVQGEPYRPQATLSAGVDAVTATPAGRGMNMGGGNARQSSPQSGMAQGMDDRMQSMGDQAQGGMSDVLRIQFERMELESRMESLLAETKAGYVRFNMLLNRPAGSPVSLPDTMICIPFLTDAETLLSEINERNPSLGMLREESLAYGAKVEMDRKMGYPMWGVGLQYMLMAPLRNTMDGMAPAMNGKDMLMPMLSVSVPIYRSKYKAAQAESRLLQLAGQEKYADARNRLVSELHQGMYLLGDARRKIDLYRRQTSLLRTTADLAAQEFTSGRTGLGSVIQILRQLLDYQISEAEAVAAYNTTVATIQKLTTSYSE